jgi:hypothetical protein
MLCIVLRCVPDIRGFWYLDEHQLWRALLLVLLSQAIQGAFLASALLFMLRMTRPVKVPERKS